jgi:hypothetical protein
MGLFKRVTPKEVESINFPGLSDALWYGVVNIETAELRIATKIPEVYEATVGPNTFSIQTGDGDGDYPVFALDEAAWIDDPNPQRRAWGICIPFFRGFDEICHNTLVEESYDGIVNLSSFTLGYFPDQQEQLVSGKRISYVGDLTVDDLLFVFDSSSQRGSGNVFVDIPLHSGSYRVYLIEDTVRNLKMDEYMKEAYTPEEWSEQFDDYDVVRVLLIVHEEKIGLLNKKIYPLNSGLLQEISMRLEGKDVATKAVPGPGSYNAVMKNFWISIWSTRYLHATSWNIQGLTFPPKFAQEFESILEDVSKESDPNQKIDVEWCVNRRGILKSDIKLSSKALKERLS